jgi:hypothetical protein
MKPHKLKKFRQAAEFKKRNSISEAEAYVGSYLLAQRMAAAIASDPEKLVAVLKVFEDVLTSENIS